MKYNIKKEPDQAYHAQNVFNGGRCLSSHSLIEFIKCPAVYQQKCSALMPPKDSDAYRVGRAAHCRILEGRDEYDSRYVFGGPVNPKTNKPFGQTSDKYKNWKAEQEAAGMECLSDSDDMLCQFMASGVGRHPEAMELLQEGVAEAVVRATYCGMLCQIKIDWLRDDCIVDLKSCRDLERFYYDFRDYRYHNQLSFYQKVFEQFYGVRLPVKVIAVEKAAPYRAAVYEVEQDKLDAAQIENEKAMHELRECQESGLWLTGYEGLRKI